MTRKEAETAALAALLKLEASARRRLRNAVRDVRRHHERTKTPEQAPITLAAMIEAEIRNIREDAATQAEQSIRQTIEGEGNHLPEVALALLLLLRRNRTRIAEDVVRARTIAHRTANLFAEKIHASYTKRIERGMDASAPRILGDAETAIRHRIDTIAATEPSQALSANRAAIIYELPPPPGSLWMKRWDAVLDRYVCEECAALDGTIRRASESFPGHAIPGHVHPRCRCMAHFYLVDAERIAA
jgi:hypothetical protein